MKVSSAFGLIFLLALPSAGRAQQADDDINAVAAALPAIMTKVPAGPTAVVYNDRSADLSKRLAVKTRTTLEPESSKLDCRKDPTGVNEICALKSVSSVVNIGGVRLNGDGASVFFTIEIPSGSTTVPIEHYLYAVDLRRSDAGWIVVRVRSVAIS